MRLEYLNKQCFAEPYPLDFIFGGALLGYCLFHAPMMNMKTMERLTVPGGLVLGLAFHVTYSTTEYLGEWFWLSKNGFKVAYPMHVYLSISKIDPMHIQFESG